MTREQIEQEIAEICAFMKGPLPDLERALLHERRKDLRKRLAEPATPAPAPGGVA